MTATDVPGGDAGRHLYGLAPEEFTAARNALAKHLRASGDKDGAASVARLRRPTTTAWALNKVAREHPAVIEAVMDAGETLRAATEKALAGDASWMRTAQAVERHAVEGATTAAAAFLSAAGHGAGDGARQRMAATLRAAMVDETVAAALRDGVLDDDREAPGFGLDAFSAAAAGTATRRRATPRGRNGPATPEPGAGAGPASESGTGGRRRPADEAGGDEGAEAAASAERQAVAQAAVLEARTRAAQLEAAAEEAERAAQAALDAAVAARQEAEDAAARAREADEAADAAAEAARVARSASDDAAAHAEEAAQVLGRG